MRSWRVNSQPPDHRKRIGRVELQGLAPCIFFCAIVWLGSGMGPRQPRIDRAKSNLCLKSFRLSNGRRKRRDLLSEMPARARDRVPPGEPRPTSPPLPKAAKPGKFGRQWIAQDERAR